MYMCMRVSLYVYVIIIKVGEVMDLRDRMLAYLCCVTWLTVARKWNQHKDSSTNRWIIEKSYTHVMEFY